MRILNNLIIAGLLLVIVLTFIDCERVQSANNLGVSAVVEPSAVNKRTPSDVENKISQENVLKMKLKVGERTFTAKLYDNETSRALLAQLPMSINMTELHGQEKYYNLPEDLPANGTEAPSIIHEGDIMRWSTNCLVLFYTTYENSHSGYAKIGYIEDIDGLKEAVGTGNVQVTFMQDI